jgi:hypothetical protein
MRTSKSVILTGAAMVAGGVLAAAVSASAGGVTAARAGTTAPARFNHPVANAYFPLEPGTVSRYRGTDEGERLHEKVVVTHRTKTIQGVRTTVVRDVLRRADGTLAEKTHDWYAADNDGNVWYFGENTATYDEQGHLESREGSWEAGVDGAVAGKIMPADPRPSTAYRQELYRKHAEDQAWIVQRNARAHVPYGRLDHVVRSFEWSRLEPHVLSVKLYAPGLGIVREKDLTGGSEVFELVSVSHR